MDYDEPTAGHLRCFFGDGQGWPINWLEDTPNICWSTWWVQIWFYFTPNFGELIQFDEHVSQMGGNHQLLTVYLPRKVSGCLIALLGDGFMDIVVY